METFRRSDASSIFSRRFGISHQSFIECLRRGHGKFIDRALNPNDRTRIEILLLERKPRGIEGVCFFRAPRRSRAHTNQERTRFITQNI
ncbi:Bacterio-opsin activator HTH domain-containing protein [Halalkalicoccus jeotgali B3]|uniref:Bacterio-opsin activator HTH domain-containing protein n=1 Tax=Halalkalicoccus jeotgali (strain DSM 18796 / CECT 7217 / JCM 14584 / KCTC 4019 / B3) TaxID=795797 RepID=L9VUH1_HALJB|nr:Bacterio-opsin activator HTH domain-containing protein [Halalkalicoccus jeotgali B3]